MNILFDLDGTLIDSRRRLYMLFQHLVPDSRLSHDQYWEFKKNKIPNQEILSREMNFDQVAVDRFVEQWMGLIESPEFLGLDVAFPGIHDSLEILGKQARLYVCTARQHRSIVLEQLHQLGLDVFFREILVTGQQHSKDRLIQQRIPNLSGRDWMVGDTGKDVEVGKALGIKTCAVLSGFQNRTTLLGYSPDLILESAVDFLPIYTCYEKHTD